MDKCMGCLEPMPHDHRFCKVCGWRQGGIDSWDGKACKCGIRSIALPIGDPSVSYMPEVGGWVR